MGVVMRLVKSVVLISLINGLVGCAPSSMFTQEGAGFGIVSGLLGGGAGYLIGEEVGKKTENTLLGTGVGVGLGMMAGGLIHEQNVRTAQKRTVVVREARLIGETQKELDHLRNELTESTTWGGNEVKPWNERYWGEDTGIPYQGAVAGR